MVLRKLRSELTVPATNFDRAAAELADSVVGLARAREGVARRYQSRTSLGNMEQLVCEGHPKHPCAKTSLGLGDAYKDVLPEQVETIQLRFVAVREQLARTSGMPLIAALRSQIPGLADRLAAECPPGFVVVPVHPCQEVALSDDVRELATSIAAEPLMSVRTLRVSDETGCVHIKTSVGFQLTGAIRGISYTALAGPVIAERAEQLMRTMGISPYTSDDTPAFRVARDLAGVRVPQADGNSFGAIVRVPPQGIPAAALLATNPLTGENFFAEFLAESGATPAEWFDRLSTILIQPALTLLDQGLAMEPHPQNTVIELRNGWPYAVTVRDFGGCRIVRDSAFGQRYDWGFLEGTALLSDRDTAYDKLIYPMITNLVLGLCEAAGIDPGTIALDNLPPMLPRKRMFGMRLSGAVTEQDYVRIPNPIPPVPLVDELPWAREHVSERLTETMAVEGLTQLPECDVDNAVTTLAHVKQVVDRRLRFYRSPADLISTAPPELRGVVADSLAITGHNVHPLAKLRLGFSVEDSALYGPENFRPTNLKLIGVHPNLLAETGDVTAILRAEFPENMPNTTLRIVPVHPWQWEHVIGAEFAREIAAGTIVDTGATLPVLPTLSLRTALTFHPGTSGRRLFIKTSVDATLTSTRRSMSRDSALGTPLVAAHLAGLGLPCDLLPEIAGCAYDGPKTNPRAVRGLSTLIRKSTPRTAITAAALRGLPTVTEEFFSRYARDLLSTVLPTMWHAGIALEAHLQNTLVYVDDDFQYQGICLRDFSGLRAYRPRATGVPIRDGAITMTDDYDVFIAKGYYAAIPGNLAAFVDQLPGDPRHYWRLVRSIVTDLIAEHNPPQADVDKLLAPTMKQKAFLRMLADPARGDVYVDVPNPLVG